MLVLTRKIGETIRIGDDVVVHVLPPGRRPGVRIGIEAPREVKILRGELVPHDERPTDAAKAQFPSRPDATVRPFLHCGGLPYTREMIEDDEDAGIFEPYIRERLDLQLMPEPDQVAADEPSRKSSSMRIADGFVGELKFMAELHYKASDAKSGEPLTCLRLIDVRVSIDGNGDARGTARYHGSPLTEDERRRVTACLQEAIHGRVLELGFEPDQVEASDA